MASDFQPQRLDVRRFGEQGATLGGERPLSSFARLLAEAEGRGGDAPVHWRAEGDQRQPLGGKAEPLLHLTAEARLQLTCQRCLHPVDVDVAADRRFRFAPDEDSAADLDDESEDEDVLAEDPAFDLLGLIEDELLMALPLVPRHDACPEAVPLAAGDEEAPAERPNPFAVLAQLKGRGKSGPGL